jgi:hypothetical protein
MVIREGKDGLGGVHSWSKVSTSGVVGVSEMESEYEGVGPGPSESGSVSEDAWSESGGSSWSEAGPVTGSGERLRSRLE